MPTSRPRHVITETPDVAHTLDLAARLWPESRHDRAALLRKVLARGAAGVEEDAGERRAQRLAAIRETAGAFTGMWPPGEAQRLKEEWPE